MQNNPENREDYLPSSFRDPSGRIYKKKGKIYRNIHISYKDDYDHLIQSNLYDELIVKGWLIPHQEISTQVSMLDNDIVYKTILPEMIPFISYPYEWCFSQLKDAAVRTLEIQLLSLKHRMMLKDASAYNIQFRDGNPVLIDTLSFKKIILGEPWPAYQQFCKHFLAPLTLMSNIDSRMNQLTRSFIDGIPLDLTSRILPRSSWIRPTNLIHLHLHAWMQNRHSSTKNSGVEIQKKPVKVKESGVKAVIESLLKSIKRINFPREQTEWGDYYTDTNYTERGLKNKIEIVDNLLHKIAPKTVWDIGANNGFFSRLASEKNYLVIAMDGDHEAVEHNYRKSRKNNEKCILPLLMDMTNPSAGIGFNNNERSPLFERGPADLAMALALVHHLAISNNTPFDILSKFFALCCRDLIIEFIPKDDTQVKRLLASREDIFTNYTQVNFEKAFEKYFDICEKFSILDSTRIIYHLKN